MHGELNEGPDKRAYSGTMKWSVAYHWNLDKDITISEAMQLRKNKDPRAGEIHCCRSCYKNKKGTRINTRKKSIDGKRAHFAMWKGSNQFQGSKCNAASIAESKRESMDYAIFYYKFQEYLNELIGNKPPFFIHSVNVNTTNQNYDFEIMHHSSNDISIKKTLVTIIDENKRRKSKYAVSHKVDAEVVHCILHISEYTPEQLNDFEIGGIRKFCEQWNGLNKIELEGKAKMQAQFEEYPEYLEVLNLFQEYSGNDLIDTAKNPDRYRWDNGSVVINSEDLRLANYYYFLYIYNSKNTKISGKKIPLMNTSYWKFHRSDFFDFKKSGVQFSFFPRSYNVMIYAYNVCLKLGLIKNFEIFVKQILSNLKFKDYTLKYGTSYTPNLAAISSVFEVIGLISRGIDIKKTLASPDYTDIEKMSIMTDFLESDIPPQINVKGGAFVQKSTITNLFDKVKKMKNDFSSEIKALYNLKRRNWEKENEPLEKFKLDSNQKLETEKEELESKITKLSRKTRWKWSYPEELNFEKWESRLFGVKDDLKLGIFERYNREYESIEKRRKKWEKYRR